MNNEELGRLHLESKRRRIGKVEEEEKILLPVINEQKKYIMCLDLTNEEEVEEHQPLVQEQQALVQEQPQQPQQPQQQRRVAVARRALPLQDIQLLDDAEREFGEVIRPCGTSKDRLKKSRGKSDEEPIVVCDDILCDCRVKCLEGYECKKNKHVQCLNLVKKECGVLKCYLCGSNIA